MHGEESKLKLKIMGVIEDKGHGFRILFGENMISVQALKTFGIWIFVWFMLVFASQIFRAVLWIITGLVSVHVASWIYQALRTTSPKTLIKETSGKAVVITGCDTGFGHELALRLHQLGFKVFAGCLFPDGEGAKSLLEKSSEKITILEIDVTDDTKICNAVKIVKYFLEESKDRLWALVNNAGIAAVSEIELCPLEVYSRVFDVNTLGLIRITKAFLPLLRQNEGNRIIIVTSLAGRYTFPGFSAYSMSKHAAASFGNALRLEMRKWNISVHTVEPTLYKTPIADLSQLKNSLEKAWDDSPDDVKKSYGKEYLEDLRSSFEKHLQRAKPMEKIREVIDDMVHAVAGEEPKCRYVPSLQTQLVDHILSSLPMELLDNVAGMFQPRTPPADIEGMRKTRFQF